MPHIWLSLYHVNCCLIVSFVLSESIAIFHFYIPQNNEMLFQPSEGMINSFIPEDGLNKELCSCHTCSGNRYKLFTLKSVHFYFSKARCQQCLYQAWELADKDIIFMLAELQKKQTMFSTLPGNLIVLRCSGGVGVQLYRNPPTNLKLMSCCHIIKPCLHELAYHFLDDVDHS